MRIYYQDSMAGFWVGYLDIESLFFVPLIKCKIRKGICYTQNQGNKSAEFVACCSDCSTFNWPVKLFLVLFGMQKIHYPPPLPPAHTHKIKNILCMLLVMYNKVFFIKWFLMFRMKISHSWAWYILWIIFSSLWSMLGSPGLQIKSPLNRKVIIQAMRRKTSKVKHQRRNAASMMERSVYCPELTWVKCVMKSTRRRMNWRLRCHTMQEGESMTSRSEIYLKDGRYILQNCKICVEWGDIVVATYLFKFPMFTFLVW